MSLRKYIYTFLFIVCQCSFCFATKYHFEAFPSTGSFGSDICVSSAEDRNGFLWLGTNNGLYQWNGQNLKKVSLPVVNSNLVNDIKISSLALDHDGMLWIGSAVGVFCFDPVSHKGRKIPFPETNVPHLLYVVNDLDILSDNTVLIGTRNGLLYFDREQDQFVYDKRFSHISTTTAIVSKDKRVITDIMQDSKHRVWISTEGGGVHLFDSNQQPLIVFGEQQIGTDTVLSMYEDFNNQIWMIGSNGVVCLDDLYKRQYDKEKLLSSYSVNYITSDEKNEVLIGTDKGVLIYDVSKSSLKTISDTPQNEPNSDLDGVVYIAPWSKRHYIIGSRTGIFSMVRNRFVFDLFKHQKGKSPSLSGNLLRVIIQDPSSNRYLYIATMNGGVDLLNSQENTINPITFDPGLDKKNYTIRCGMVDHHKNIFFGTDKGILRLLKGKKRLIKSRFYGLPISNEPILSMFHALSGEYWICGMNTGLIRYNPQTTFIRKYIPKGDKNDVTSRNIKALFQSTDGTIWVGTHNKGICRYVENGDKFIQYSTADTTKNLLSDKIFCFFEDSRGVLWVGTGKGLGVYDPVNDCFHKFKSRRIEVDLMVQSIQEDIKGRLWLGTNGGIKCLDIEQDHYASFIMSDGLQSNVFEYNVAAKNSRYIYMGGNNGLNRFKPIDFSPKYSNTRAGVVSISKVLSDGQVLVVPNQDLYNRDGGLKTIELDGNVESVIVKLSILNVLDQTKCRYAYKTNSGDKWNWLGELENSIELPVKGEHNLKLKIRGTNQQGMMSRNIIDLEFVHHSFLPTLLFAFIFLILLSSIGYYIFYFKKKKSHLNHFEAPVNNTADERTENSDLSEDISLVSPIIEEGEKIREALEVNQWYLDRNLNKHLFARHLHISMSHLSTVLREGLKTNFNDLINGYRIEEVKKRLKDPMYKDYTLLGIAEDCGFNSKTSFYRIFKKYTGITPTEYIQKDNLRDD